MKKITSILALSLLLTSCSCSVQTSNVNSEVKQDTIVRGKITGVIEVIDLPYSKVYIIPYNNDTIYAIEGINKETPVSITR